MAGPKKKQRKVIFKKIKERQRQRETETERDRDRERERERERETRADARESKGIRKQTHTNTHITGACTHRHQNTSTQQHDIFAPKKKKLVAHASNVITKMAASMRTQATICFIIFRAKSHDTHAHAYTYSIIARATMLIINCPVGLRVLVLVLVRVPVY